ncbi:ETC complex I subunit [Candidatus Pelagibacter communis]|jgi:NADH dehydrogenase (ubiquinone) Fe-S protein 4|uniref:ETC complex I subunit n=1 Tax=Pelagibacter ubique TaxID=198252 RepID=UPI00094C21C3|nr:ETC complex I subunit [Candidatus Pelagibacter ubique]
MKKAKIYKPSKTAMQSGIKKFDKWIIEFITEKPGINPLMGWESSTDTNSELKLEFSSKELAIEYAKKNKINFELIEPKIRKIIKKSYADNFTK